MNPLSPIIHKIRMDRPYEGMDPPYLEPVLPVKVRDCMYSTYRDNSGAGKKSVTFVTNRNSFR